MSWGIHDSQLRQPGHDLSVKAGRIDVRGPRRPFRYGDLAAGRAACNRRLADIHPDRAVV